MCVVVGHGGCDPTCTAPSCESDWPRTRVALHYGGGWPEQRDVWDADLLVDGIEAAGAEWAVTSVDRRPIFGQPEVDQVVVAMPNGALRSDLGARVFWADDEELGASVRATAVASDGEWTLYAGAPAADLRRGAVYRVADPDDGGGQIETRSLRIDGAHQGDRFGQTISLCTDVTGDGESELVVHAPWYDQGGELPSLVGAIWFLDSELLSSLDRTTSVSSLAVPQWWGATAGATAGAAVVCDVDVDADGMNDLVVGAPFGGSDAGGRVYVRTDTQADGAPGSLDQGAFQILEGPQPNAWFGAALTTLVGEHVFVAIGTPGLDVGRGGVEVWAIVGGQLVPWTTILSHDRPGGDHVGNYLAAGDTDGDGAMELLVGAPGWHTNDEADIGRLWVFRAQDLTEGSVLQVERDEVARIEGTAAFQRVGREIHVADLGHDGVDDVLLPTRASLEF